MTLESQQRENREKLLAAMKRDGIHYVTTIETALELNILTASTWHAAQREVVEREKALLSALESMYEQYCVNGHAFMSAGEDASAVMEKYGYDFDGAGRLTKYPDTFTGSEGEKSV